MGEPNLDDGRAVMSDQAGAPGDVVGQRAGTHPGSACEHAGLRENIIGEASEPDAIALVVLAAGESRRMGRPKQLLPVGGEPLVRRVVRELSEGFGGEIVVVLGAQASAVGAALDGLPVRTVLNEAWAEGMGASLSCGVAAALAAERPPKAVVIALADQPGVGGAHVARLQKVWRETGRPVVASASSGVVMPPVLFAAEWYRRLLALAGDSGARALLRTAGADLEVVPAGPWPDLDTPEEYEGFLRANV